MVPHHPETLPPPLVVAAWLTDRITEHVVSRVFFLQTVPGEQKEPVRPSDQRVHNTSVTTDPQLDPLSSAKLLSSVT